MQSRPPTLPSRLVDLLAQAADRGDASRKSADAAAPSRGRGGLGRREADDLYVMVTPQDQALETKASKRRLFASVMDRFDKADSNARAGGGGAGGGTAGGGGPVESFADARQQWLSPDHSASTKRNAAAEAAPDSAARVGGAGRDKATATWTKPTKNKETPDRFARFLGKVLGVKDDALPDRPIEDQPGGSTGSTGGAARGDEKAAVPSLRSPTDDAAHGAVATESSGAARGSGRPSETFAATGARGGSASAADTTPAPAAGASPVAAAGAASSVIPATPRATAVYAATATATADAMPVAVAVAVPLQNQAGARADPSAPARRPSRSGRTPRAASSRSNNDSAAHVGTGEAVSISGWVAKEERESGGVVRVFSAQRVLEGKVQRKCRLAVSRKNMTQVRTLDHSSCAYGVVGCHSFAGGVTLTIQGVFPERQRVSTGLELGP